MDEEKILAGHKRRNGKVEVMPKVPLATQEDLSTYYTPGVAYASLEIKKNKDLAYDYTSKSNTIAIVSDGTRILGLGNIGPEAGMPVMEGKSALFKKFGGVDAVPLCVGTTNEEEILAILKGIAPSFGAINIEDIESPKVYNIVRRAQEMLDIPVFHDDRQGTAVVVLAALMNSLKLAGKDKNARIVINGAGTAGTGIAELAIQAGFHNISVLDTKGALYQGREDMNDAKKELAAITNKDKRSGTLKELAAGADVLIGVSTKNAFTADIVRSMGDKSIVFALSNPIPEILYQDAKNAGAFIAATGRSDMPNQVNNVLAFPGIMRGALYVRAKHITMKMLHASAIALARSVGKNLSTEYILPGVLDKHYEKAAMDIACAVADSAAKEGVARISKDPKEIRVEMKAMAKRYRAFEKRFI